MTHKLIEDLIIIGVFIAPFLIATLAFFIINRTKKQ